VNWFRLPSGAMLNMDLVVFVEEYDDGVTIRVDGSLMDRGVKVHAGDGTFVHLVDVNAVRMREWMRTAAVAQDSPKETEEVPA
jgi:hypothetical protein